MDQKELAKLKWRCRRGTKELDVMLSRFVDKYIDDLSNQQIKTFKRLLAQQDPDLSHWLVDQKKLDDKGLSEIVRLIQKANNL